MGAQVKNPTEQVTLDLLRAYPSHAYIYILRRPDGIPCWGGMGTPFYVGKGHPGRRIFQHERQALSPKRRYDPKGREYDFLKKEAIRGIVGSGQFIGYSIDSFWGEQAVSCLHLREIDLLRAIGLLRDGTGPLTNRQRYEAGPSDYPDYYLERRGLLPDATTAPAKMPFVDL